MPLEEGWTSITIIKHSMFSWEGMIFCWRCHQDPARIDAVKMKERMARADWSQEKIGYAVIAITDFMIERLELIKGQTEDIPFLQEQIIELEEAISLVKGSVLKLVIEKLEELTVRLEEALLFQGAAIMLEEAVEKAEEP